MKTKLSYAMLVIIVALSLMITACGTPAAPVNPPLRIAVDLWPGVYPAAIAQEQGFFAKHNVQVKLVYYDSYFDTYADLVSGKVDGVTAVINDELLISNQMNINFVFPTDTSDGADVVIAGADIQSVSDLRGKRIGVKLGTNGEFFVRTYLKQNGIAATDVTLMDIPADNTASAFPSLVDAIHTYDPFASDGLKNGGHVLFDSSKTPNLILAAMTFPTKLIKERPQDIQAFTDAWFEAVDWMNAHPDKVPAVVAKGFGLKPEDIWLGGDKVFSLAEAKALMQPGNDTSSIYFITQEYVDFLVTSGALSTKPNPETLIDPSFLK